MYGGTCINVGCIPSKVLIHDGARGKDFQNAARRKAAVVTALNKKNYNNLATEENIEIIDGRAKFVTNKEIKATLSSGGEE